MASTEAEVLRSLILVLNEIYLTYDFNRAKKPNLLHYQKILKISSCYIEPPTVDMDIY
jgi:hypothetical protein